MALTSEVKAGLITGVATLIVGIATLNQALVGVFYDDGLYAGLATALDVVKPRGTVVLKSTHHGTTTLDTSQVVVNEVRIVGSRCGRLRPAIDLLSIGVKELGTLVSRRLPLESGLFAFEEASASENLKVILQVA